MVSGTTKAMKMAPSMQKPAKSHKQPKSWIVVIKIGIAFKMTNAEILMVTKQKLDPTALICKGKQTCSVARVSSFSLSAHDLLSREAPR